MCSIFLRKVAARQLTCETLRSNLSCTSLPALCISSKSQEGFIARFTFPNSLLSLIHLLLLCLLGGFTAQPAVAQHSGGHGGVGAARTFVPPASRIPVHPPAFRPSPYASQFGRGGIYSGPFPIRRFPPLFPAFGYPFYFGYFGGPFWFLGGWGYNPCWWLNCYLYWNWNYSYNATPWNSNSAQNYVQPQNYQYSLYAYGSGRSGFPQLYLKDGTAITVSDYRLVGDQLHFVAIEGAKRVERTIPLEDLDLQTTIDVNTHSGFRFVQRNEPMEQYQRDHPNENPPDWPAPKQ